MLGLGRDDFQPRFVKQYAALGDRAVEAIQQFVGEVGDGSYGSRHLVWGEATELLGSRPWLGVGSGAFIAAAVENRKAPHNFALSILVELGIIGFALCVAVLVATGLGALRQDRWLCRLWLVMLVMWVMNAAVHNYEDKKNTWVFFSFVAIGAGLSPRDESSATSLSSRPSGDPYFVNTIAFMGYLCSRDAGTSAIRICT